MAIVPSRSTVTTAATLIVSNASGGTVSDLSTVSTLITNESGTPTDIFLGGTTSLTTANGFRWRPEHGPFSLDLEPGEAVYGIVAAGSQQLHVLRGGR